MFSVSVVVIVVDAVVVNVVSVDGVKVNVTGGDVPDGGIGALYFLVDGIFMDVDVEWKCEREEVTDDVELCWTR